MKTFLEHYEEYLKDKGLRFSVYYVVKGKNARVEESDGCTFRTADKISVCRPPRYHGGWMRNVTKNASNMYFGYFNKKDLDTSVLTDNVDFRHKTIYLNREDAEKELATIRK